MEGNGGDGGWRQEGGRRSCSPFSSQRAAKLLFKDISLIETKTPDARSPSEIWKSTPTQEPFLNSVKEAKKKSKGTPWTATTLGTCETIIGLFNTKNISVGSMLDSFFRGISAHAVMEAKEHVHEASKNIDTSLGDDQVVTDAMEVVERDAFMIFK